MSRRRHLTFVLGAVISLALAATAALSLVYTPRDPLAMAGAARLEGASRTHPLRPGQYWRDPLSRALARAPAAHALGRLPPPEPRPRAGLARQHDAARSRL